jgi:hypothetical protein
MGQSKSRSLEHLKKTAEKLGIEKHRYKERADQNIAQCRDAVARGNQSQADALALAAANSRQMSNRCCTMETQLSLILQRVEMGAMMCTLTSGMSGLLGQFEKDVKKCKLFELDKVLNRYEKQFESIDMSAESMERVGEMNPDTNMQSEAVQGILSSIHDELKLKVVDLPVASSHLLSSSSSLSVPAIQKNRVNK